jgi:Flp pilus assembly protein TadD
MISIGEFEVAVDYIDRVALVKWPGSAMLRAFRGMALIRMGRREAARDCLMEAAQSADEAAANLARGLLE